MVSSTAATALLLLAAAGSSMAAIPVTGTYKADTASTATLNALTNACDKTCLGTIGVASNAAANKVSIMGTPAAAGACKCSTVTVPYDATANSLTFTNVVFSEGGVSMSGTAKPAVVKTEGGNTSGGAKPTTSSKTTATTTTTSASPTATVLARRRREIFARADTPQLTFTIGATGSSANGVVTYLQDSTTTPVTQPSSANKVYVAGAAVLSAGVAAIVAGIVGM